VPVIKVDDRVIFKETKDGGRKCLVGFDVFVFGFVSV